MVQTYPPLSPVPSDLPVRAAGPHCSEGRHRQGERGIGRCMAERRGRERKSGPVLAHARRPAHEGGRRNGKKIFPSFLLPSSSSFLGGAIGLAVARSVAAAAAANASGSVM